MTTFAAESAGAICTTAVPVMVTSTTVTEARRHLEQLINQWQTVNYIYVVGSDSALFGVISIKELLQASPEMTVDEIMRRELMTVLPEADRETVAHFAVAHSIKAVPVCDSKGQFIGVVDTDTILRTLHEEATEDLVRLAGVVTESLTPLASTSIWHHIRSRAPWLLLGLLGGLAAALAVQQFESVLEQHVLVAAFIPLVVYLADAIGSQIQIIFIRALAITPGLSIISYVRREFWVNIALGLLLASVVAIVVWQWFGDGMIALVLLLSVFATAATALVIAVTLPLGLRALGKDPALGSGPLATVCIDIISLLIYFTIASWLLFL